MATPQSYGLQELPIWRQFLHIHRSRPEEDAYQLDKLKAQQKVLTDAEIERKKALDVYSTEHMRELIKEHFPGATEADINALLSAQEVAPAQAAREQVSRSAAGMPGIPGEVMDAQEARRAGSQAEGAVSRLQREVAEGLIPNAAQTAILEQAKRGAIATADTADATNREKRALGGAARMGTVGQEQTEADIAEAEARQKIAQENRNKVDRERATKDIQARVQQRIASADEENLPGRLDLAKRYQTRAREDFDYAAGIPGLQHERVINQELGKSQYLPISEGGGLYNTLRGDILQNPALPRVIVDAESGQVQRFDQPPPRRVQFKVGSVNPYAGLNPVGGGATAGASEQAAPDFNAPGGNPFNPDGTAVNPDGTPGQPGVVPNQTRMTREEYEKFLREHGYKK